MATVWWILDHLMATRRPGGAWMTSPRQVCLDLSNWVDDGGARLIWCSMPNKLNVKSTHMEGPRALRLDVSWHSWRRRGGGDGKTAKGGGGHTW